jgi:hypothetical protein
MEEFDHKKNNVQQLCKSVHTFQCKNGGMQWKVNTIYKSIEEDHL